MKDVNGAQITPGSRVNIVSMSDNSEKLATVIGVTKKAANSGWRTSPNQLLVNLDGTGKNALSISYYDENIYEMTR